MEKQVFLDCLRGHLLERGVGEATIERQLARLSEYIDAEGGDHVEAMLDEEDPVLLADEICASLRRNAARRAAQQRPAVQPQQAAPMQQPTHPQQAVHAQQRPVQRPLMPVQQSPVAPQQAQPAVYAQQPAVKQAAATQPHPVNNARTREMDIVHPSQTFEIADLQTPAISEQPAADFHPAEPDEVYLPTYADAEAMPRKQRRNGRHAPQRGQEAEIKGGPMFWAAVPFLALFAAVVFALFAVGFVVLVGLFLLAIAALAVIAAAGTAFTLVSLIYGIVQMLSVLPIGLYELGIGITAGGIVLFVSLLLYNYAIRLTPFALRGLGRCLMQTVRWMRGMFIRVKGACAAL